MTDLFDQEARRSVPILQVLRRVIIVDFLFGRQFLGHLGKSHWHRLGLSNRCMIESLAVRLIEGFAIGIGPLDDRLGIVAGHLRDRW